VPRAKRTDRAEARRRHRAALDAAATGEDPEALDEPVAPAGRGGVPRPAATAAQRPSIGNAFRAAFHPLTLREDLRNFPPLLAHRAVWLPILLTLVAGILFTITDGNNTLVVLVATYFIAPPALGSVFIAGFLSPRSSYLIGLVVGLASAAIFAGVLLATGTSAALGGTGTAGASPSSSIVAGASASPAASVDPGASPAPSPTPVASASPGASPIAPSTSTQDQIIYAFLTSPPFGMFFAATAAWYRRFLKLSNPNRGRPTQRRGTDGRSRGNQRPSGRR
jgi:hypothetical protein